MDDSDLPAFNFYTNLGFVHAIDLKDMKNQLTHIEHNLSFDFNDDCFVCPLDDNDNLTHELHLCTNTRFGPNQTKAMIDKQEEKMQLEIDLDKMEEENKEKLVKIDSDKIVDDQQPFLRCQNLLHLKALKNYKENCAQSKNWLDCNDVWVLILDQTKTSVTNL